MPINRGVNKLKPQSGINTTTTVIHLENTTQHKTNWKEGGSFFALKESAHWTRVLGWRRELAKWRLASVVLCSFFWLFVYRTHQHRLQEMEICCVNHGLQHPIIQLVFLKEQAKASNEAERKTMLVINSNLVPKTYKQGCMAVHWENVTRQRVL